MKNFNKILVLYLCMFCMISCDNDRQKLDNNSSEVDTSAINFRVLDANNTGIHFTNSFEQTAQRNVLNFDPIQHGGGVSIIDYNNDGLEDIFFTGNDVSNCLYQNKGNFQFEDVTLQAGLQSDKWSNSSSIVDINEDGWLDIYVCNGGPGLDKIDMSNDLYINQKNGTFKEASADYGLDISSLSSQGVFADFDRDGDLDFYLANTMIRSLGTSVKNFVKQVSSQENAVKIEYMQNMYFENYEGKYIDKSKANNLHTYAFSRAVIASDLNKDGWLDLFVSNDFFVPDYLYINSKNGSFEQKNNVLLSHTSRNSKGADLNDINNDQKIDIAVVDRQAIDPLKKNQYAAKENVEEFYHLHNGYNFPFQYRNNSILVGKEQSRFSNLANYSGIQATGFSWAPLLADFNNDGLKDFFVTNGISQDIYNLSFRDSQNKLLTNAQKGKNAYDLLKQTKGIPSKNLWFKNLDGIKMHKMDVLQPEENKHDSRGAAYADLDNDGDLDLVINNIGTKASILENKANNNWLSVTLKDTINENKVLHAKITIYSEDLVQYQEYQFDRGFHSTSSRRLHFGLGNSRKVDSIKVYYLDGTLNAYYDIKTNQQITLHKKASEKRKGKRLAEEIGIFLDLTDRIENYNYQHVQANASTKNTNQQAPYQMDFAGPVIAVGDVDNDGFDDFFMGGGKNFAAKVIVQKENTFKTLENKVFFEDINYHDTGATFFDYNNDGRLDLYVASGGDKEVSSDSLAQDRLYFNNGGGQMLRIDGVLPPIRSSSTNIIADDFNGDGLQDLFVAGRNKPGKYGDRADSYMLMHSGGPYVNQIANWFSFEELPHFITDVVYMDLDLDGKKDFVMSSEWDSPAIFLRKDNRFERIKDENLDKFKGWWQTAAAGDIDGDGDMDFVFANIGENMSYKATEENPLKLYSGDFNLDNQHEVIICQFFKDRYIPQVSLDVIADWFPFTSSKIEQFGYKEIASLPIEELLSDQILANANTYEANTFKHMVFINQGDFSFNVKHLAEISQHSAIKQIMVEDFNSDGLMDVFCVGNLQHTSSTNTISDAGSELLFYGNENGQLTINNEINSGIQVIGVANRLRRIKLGSNQTGIIIGNNRGPIQLALYNYNQQK